MYKIPNLIATMCFMAAIYFVGIGHIDLGIVWIAAGLAWYE
jgi:hypothetical protein